MVLFQGISGGPTATEAEQYAEYIGAEDYIVGSDVAEEVLDNTPYDGQSLPGKCVLSPDMVMLECESGHGNEEMFEAIKADAGL